MYQLKALWLLLTSPSLLISILLPLICVFVLSILATIALFVFALYPQAQGLISLSSSPSSAWIACAWILAVVITCLECTLCVGLLALIFLQSGQDRIFDHTLKSKCPHLYERSNLPGLQQAGHSLMRLFGGGRDSTTSNQNNDSTTNTTTTTSTTQLLGSSLMASVKSLGYLIALAPINIVPILGEIVYVVIEGYYQGPLAHERYFKLKNFTPEQKAAFIKKYKREYWMFGMARTTLDLIPLINVVGVYINAMSAALFAADLEEKEREGEGEGEGEGSV